MRFPSNVDFCVLHLLQCFPLIFATIHLYLMQPKSKASCFVAFIKKGVGSLPSRRELNWWCVLNSLSLSAGLLAKDFCLKKGAHLVCPCACWCICVCPEEMLMQAHCVKNRPDSIWGTVTNAWPGTLSHIVGGGVCACVFLLLGKGAALPSVWS